MNIGSDYKCSQTHKNSQKKLTNRQLVLTLGAALLEIFSTNSTDKILKVYVRSVLVLLKNSFESIHSSHPLEM